MARGAGATIYPSEVGLEQACVAELLFQAMEASPVERRPGLYANIVLMGGNCCFPGFRERIYMNLRPLVSDTYNISLFVDEDPLCKVCQRRNTKNMDRVPPYPDCRLRQTVSCL